MVVIPIHDENPTTRRPVVTILIIAACLVVFAFLQPAGPTEPEFLYERAAVPCELSQGRPLTFAELATDVCGTTFGPGASVEIFPEKNVWLSGLASLFLHGSWLHVLGNVLFLWVFGNNLEDRLGHVGFLAFYLLGGAAALGVHVLTDPGSISPVIGASGAVAAVMGAYLVLWPRARVTVLVAFLLFFPVRLPASVVLLVWLALQFVTDPNSGIAWAAHVGGFAFGAGAAWLLVRHVPPRSPEPAGPPGPPAAGGPWGTGPAAGGGPWGAGPAAGGNPWGAGPGPGGTPGPPTRPAWPPPRDTLTATRATT